MDNDESPYNAFRHLDGDQPILKLGDYMADEEGGAAFVVFRTVRCAEAKWDLVLSNQ